MGLGRVKDEKDRPSAGSFLHFVPTYATPFLCGFDSRLFLSSRSVVEQKAQIAAIAAKHTRCNLLTNRGGLLYAAYLKP